MIKTYNYTVRELQPYINWSYFYWIWQIPALTARNAPPNSELAQLDSSEEAVKEQWDVLFNDIKTILGEYDRQQYTVSARVGLFDANANGDDILVYRGNDTVTIPCLRQQYEKKDHEPNLCLSDYLMPQSLGKHDRMGVFACTVPMEMETHYADDPVYKLFGQTLCTRLVEAAAEKMHEEVRKRLWGYAPDESLTMEEMFHEKFQGIRPAIGYPSLPDQTVNFIVDGLIDMQGMGITFSENGAMLPQATVSGLMFAHPQSRYFHIGIGPDQLEDYARRRRLPVETLKKFLATYLTFC